MGSPRRARVVVLVIDSGGVGAAPDCERFGDAATVDTLGNVARAQHTFALPNLARLGLGCIARMPGVEPAIRPLAACGRLREVSDGKDTITGHWELMGIVIENAFPTYPHGFPPRIIEPFEAVVGAKVLGNKAA